MEIITGYKLLRLRRDNTLGPLFINRKQVIPFGEWLVAESHQTKGYAFRPGWHACSLPVAPHLSPKGRVWCEVELRDFEVLNRPASQGGTWYLAKNMLVVSLISSSNVLTRAA